MLKQKNLKQTLLMATICAISFTNIACKKENPKGANKVVLNIQNGEEIRHLDPQLSTGIGSAHIAINLFSGLYEYHHKTGSPEKDLALSFTKNESSTEWTFKLKKGTSWVKYENGEVKKKRPVTAHDIVYSYRRMLSPELASEYAYMLYILKNGEKYNKGEIKDVSQLGVKAIDDYTVKLTLEGPVPSLISYLPHHSFHVVPQEPIEKFKEKWISKENIWTNGPFAFKNWKLKDKIVLVKNPHYPDAKDIQADEINFKFIGGYSTDAVRAFRAGKIDIDMMSPPTSEIGPLKRSGNLVAARQLGTYYIMVNTKKEMLKDKRVRKALALVIDRKKIVKYIMKAGQQPTYSLVPNAFQGYGPQPLTSTESYEGKLKEAKKLMAEAGYPEGKGFPTVNYLYNTAETHQKVAVSVAKQWSNALGIKIKPLNQEWKVYLNSRKSFDYDLARAGWVADMEDPMNFLDMFVTDGGNNSTGFSHPQYDELIRKARIENDLNKRSKMLEQAEKILMSELPVIPLFTYTSLNLKQKYISGFYANKLDQHSLKHVKIDTLKRKELYPDL
jgi:oligopeptide transport system substrate-binding protein